MAARKDHVKERIMSFITVVMEAEEIVDSKASWEVKHELIFSDLIRGRINAYSFIKNNIDYNSEIYNDEQEEVLAYVRALKEKAAEYRKII